ncbi:MAG: tRNA-(ms[2]io[6]A)-hydroxylase, partial [Proteobacteria bacterium]|nr:tRNA-(ms[2]io[6]A)-hydroxylase [Pseudomonadota bacterium]MCP4916967.1 tRNA-(ms[2]io[6]A)-hydroxylase [Pseudomonadota bacterium]
MLHLATSSSEAWLRRALADVDTILLDHAHCEKKAASTALNLIFRYGDHHELMVPLSELAREELEHFERVLGHLERRGLAYARLHPSPYAGLLRKGCRTTEPNRLVDTLVCCAFIEARSCERMKLLAENLADPELARLYRSLLKSEARHHQTYLDMAAGFCSRDELRERIEVLGAVEADAVSQDVPEIRLHNG